jgi:hypothetical protein
MKLVLQIALGVFLGSLAASFMLDAWREHKAELAKAETDKVLAGQEKVGQEQAKLIGSILRQKQQTNPAAVITPPVGYIPDDAQTQTPRP